MVATSSTPFLRFSLVSLAILAALAATNCGSGSMSGPPKLSGNTAVTVMVSSTANDQLSEFDLAFQSITLTSQSGATVTLLSEPASGPSVGAEFMHVNGPAEPLATVSIPQDVYTAASVTVSSAEFVCIDLYVTGSGGQGVLDTHTFDDLNMPAGSTTVTLPSPITVTGDSMGLLLDLQVLQSASYSACYDPSGVYTYGITPAFNLTPLTFSAQPTNANNGKVVSLDGQVNAVGTNSLTVTLPDVEGTRQISISSNGTTVYQGVSGISGLAVGTFVDLDGAIQADGSIVASRVAVEDASAGEVFRGPIMEVTPAVSVLLQLPRMQQGSGIDGYGVGVQYFDYSNAQFQISGQLANANSLPFVPSFSAANIVPGQEVYFSYAAGTTSNSNYPAVRTMTLMPQAINGTVIGSTTVGNFTDYTMQLASYDLFPMLAVQPGQNSLLANPSRVEVYVDSSTQMLNQSALTAGSAFRFYGMVFNDNGTLRMDCAQVNDGVAATAQSNARGRLMTGTSQTTRRAGPGGLMEVNSTVTRSR